MQPPVPGIDLFVVSGELVETGVARVVERVETDVLKHASADERLDLDAGDDLLLAVAGTHLPALPIPTDHDHVEFRGIGLKWSCVLLRTPRREQTQVREVVSLRRTGSGYGERHTAKQRDTGTTMRYKPEFGYVHSNSQKE